MLNKIIKTMAKSKKNKRVWNKAKALCWYRHPFKDELHLEKRIIRSDSKDVQVWSEIYHCWMDFDWNHIEKVYEFITNFYS
jgi:hypothetical protein